MLNRPDEANPPPQAETEGLSRSVRPDWRVLATALAVSSLVLLAYANHFHNWFQFDDNATIIDNHWIRDLSNIPRFFTDGATFSLEPRNRSYRPLVSVSLAIDYWLGGGLRPEWFHRSTLMWFLAQLGLMFVLFRNILAYTRRGPENVWVALFAVALYGVHPAIAETVNYVIQRGDIYATLGVIAGLALYALAPHQRRYGLYLVPVIAGVLSKPPAVVFPLLLLFWIWLFEEVSFSEATRRSLPAFAVTGATGWFTLWMTPATFSPGVIAAYAYRITQPAVLWGYFSEFFFPLHLTADTDRAAFKSVLSLEALGGFAFVVVTLIAVWWCVKRRETRPAAFGLIWFLVASLPTSVYALGEVENDHRMYFPFVGLALSVCQVAALWIGRNRVGVRIVAPACAAILACYAWGTHERNKVWRTPESLWRDTAMKSPKNPRALLNYGAALLEKQDYAGALSLFERAQALPPISPDLETHLGMVWGALQNPEEARRHFVRAITMTPTALRPRYFYAAWLMQMGWDDQAAEHLKLIVQQHPEVMPARNLLLEIYGRAGDVNGLRALAEETVALFPSDEEAAELLENATIFPGNRETGAGPEKASTAARYVGKSNALAEVGKYRECIAAAQEAVNLGEKSGMAWNNMAGCHNGLAEWDAAIEAARQALRIAPDLELAKKNLAAAQMAKRRQRGR